MKPGHIRLQVSLNNFQLAKRTERIQSIIYILVVAGFQLDLTFAEDFFFRSKQDAENIRGDN